MLINYGSESWPVGANPVRLAKACQLRQYRLDEALAGTRRVPGLRCAAALLRDQLYLHMPQPGEPLLLEKRCDNLLV